MYTPKHFEITDCTLLFDLMQTFSFATLVSVHEGVPFATHMPFTVREEENQLTSHIARANPQWTSFPENKEVLVIFQGDHSFISPTWYDKHPSVPTWNYMTVHAYGKVKIIEDTAAVKDLLHELVLQYEKDWDMLQLPESYMQGMIKGIVAFEINITRLEGKFKLSQNRSETDQHNVVKALGQSSSSVDNAVAKAMREHVLKEQ
ncbi:MAG: FMN-binding negative transcriptional regulator [Trueperaceae bacterium]